MASHQDIAIRIARQIQSKRNWLASNKESKFRETAQAEIQNLRDEYWTEIRKMSGEQ